MKKFQKFALIGLIFFGVTVLSTFLALGGSFSDNILPELVGFSLEGIFLVILFSWYKEYLEKIAEIQKKENLKKSLTIQLGIIFQWAHPKGGIKALFTDWKNSESIESLLKELENNHKVCSVNAIFIRDHAKILSQELKYMYPVAANIGYQHFEAWSLITKAVDCLANAKNDGDTCEDLMNFLQSIKEFNTLKIKP